MLAMAAVTISTEVEITFAPTFSDSSHKLSICSYTVVSMFGTVDIFEQEGKAGIAQEKTRDKNGQAAAE